jgi:alkanesulfonate monooxygenase SsuD/methylene tetrahydromethanopterin reductase-like flavin-dependent oxidoreductase (luciferase family)
LHRSLVLATDVLTPTLELAKEAERHGFHRVWTTEYTTRDAPVRALALGLATTRLQVATGIAYAFSRLPLAAAALAADIQMLTGGRFTLGLGAGTRGMRSRFYGHDDFDHPAPRLAEYVGLLKQAWEARDGLSFHGQFYDAEVAGYSSNDELLASGPPPVYGAGLNRIMLKYAAASCDGVALHPVASVPHYLDSTVLPAIEEGRGERSVELACWMITAIGEDPEVARQQAKRNLAFYFSTPSYQSVVAGTRWEATAAKIRDQFREIGPDWARLATFVDDEMAHAFSLSGTLADVSARILEIEAALEERGCSELVFQTVGIGLDDIETVENCRRIIEALGPGPEL